jgi:hypothetical protein
MHSVRHRLLHIALRAWCIARIHRRCDTDPGEDRILSDILLLQYATAVSVLRVLHYVWGATKSQSSVMESAVRKELRKDKRTGLGYMEHVYNDPSTLELILSSNFPHFPHPSLYSRHDLVKIATKAI